ncbi:MAG: hypothetical protein IPH08_03805 [Rhodocyclaceae bacterium]|nr:hypothetical protein [Rhodocyclaceae bacterium]
MVRDVVATDVGRFLDDFGFLATPFPDSDEPARRWMVGVGIALRAGLEVHLGSAVGILEGPTRDWAEVEARKHLFIKFPAKDGWMIDLTVIEMPPGAIVPAPLEITPPPGAGGFRRNGSVSP